MLYVWLCVTLACNIIMFATLLQQTHGDNLAPAYKSRPLVHFHIKRVCGCVLQSRYCSTLNTLLQTIFFRNVRNRILVSLQSKGGH